MLPVSKLDGEFLTMIEHILEAICLLSFEQVSQVLDCVAPEVIGVTLIKESFFSFFDPFLGLFVLIVKLRVLIEKAPVVHINNLLNDLVLQRVMGVVGIEGLDHRFLGLRLNNRAQDVRQQ